MEDPRGLAKFVIKDKKSISFFWEKALSYQHFKNLYLIVRGILYSNQLEGDRRQASPYPLPQGIDSKALYKNFCSKSVVRALVKGRKGGKDASKVEMLSHALSQWQLFADLKDCSKSLQAKTIYKELGKIDACFQSFKTKIKKGDHKAKPPKARKLAKIVRTSIGIDQDCISFKRKNIVKVNVGESMVSIPFKHKSVLDLIGDFKHVQAAELLCSPSELVLTLLYRKENPEKQREKHRTHKFAGLDLGVRNTAAYFVDDKKSSSVLIDGSKLITFNADNNRKLANLKSQRDGLVEPDETSKHESFIRENLRLKTGISRLYSKRRDFFCTLFHKLSKRILEDLKKQEVTDLFVSRNLGSCKNSAGNSMGRKNNQKFHQIPILKLIDYLQLKAGEYGIEICEIDEAYTSKCSALSGDILEAQNQKNNDSKRSNVLNGRRLRRSVFKDLPSGLSFHADINAALNHIRVGLGCSKDSHVCLQDRMWKLANPVKKRLHVYKNALNCFLDLVPI